MYLRVCTFSVDLLLIYFCTKYKLLIIYECNVRLY